MSGRTLGLRIYGLRPAFRHRTVITLRFGV
jgi:hypothetical protein